MVLLKKNKLLFTLVSVSTAFKEKKSFTRFMFTKNVITKAYQGISGGFTLSDPIFDRFYANIPMFNFYVYNYLKIYHIKKPTNITYEQHLFNLTNKLLEGEALWKHPLFKPYGIVNSLEKPFSLMFPLAQNFLAHSFQKKRFDHTKIDFKSSIPLDISEYRNSGISAQNMLEINLFNKGMLPFYNFFKTKYKKDNIFFKAHNPELLLKTKTFDYKQIQPNNDFLGKVFYVEKGIEKEFVIDTKIIQYPEKNLPLLNGNLSIAHDKDFFLHINRLHGILSTMDSLDEYFQQLTSLLKKLKKAQTKNDINLTKCILMDCNDVIYTILLDSKIKDKFPSMIIEADINHTIMDENALLQLHEALNYISSLPQQLIPSMAREIPEYPLFIEKFLTQFPLDMRSNLLSNFKSLIDYSVQNSILP